MTDDQPPEAETANANEGADPTHDIKVQNPGETVTGDDEPEEPDETKVQDLAKAGRQDFDPNVENPG